MKVFPFLISVFLITLIGCRKDTNQIPILSCKDFLEGTYSNDSLSLEIDVSKNRPGWDLEPNDHNMYLNHLPFVHLNWLYYVELKMEKCQNIFSFEDFAYEHNSSVLDHSYYWALTGSGEFNNSSIHLEYILIKDYVGASYTDDTLSYDVNLIKEND